MVNEKIKKRTKILNNSDIDEKNINCVPQKESGFTSNNYDPKIIEESKQLIQVLNLKTNRKKRKIKHKKMLAEKTNTNINRETQRNEEYLRMWKNSPDKWKFEKLRQISLEQTVLRDLSEELWPIALEYLAGSKGATKERILTQANDIIQKLHEEHDGLPEQKPSLNENISYKRARDLLQSLN